MPITWSAKLIFSTSTKGSAKNSVSHTNGTPITAVRPEGTKREKKRAKALRRASAAARPDPGVVRIVVLMVQASLLREHDAAGRRPGHVHVVVPGGRAVSHEVRAGEVRDDHLAARQAHVIERVAAHVGDVRDDAA